MELNLRGRTALITGASSGIGAGVARLLADEGTRIAVTARRDDQLERVASQIEASSEQVPIVVSGDVTDAADVARIAAEAATALGHIDILVNCAGGSRPTELSASDEDWEEAFALNFTAARRLTQAILPT
ncbi:MAG: SDR family NAD(P)-dependent oxidoreductase, partial [Pigmentiphaga sp.]